MKMISNISPKCFHLTLTTLILLLGNAETQGDFNYNHNATPTANMENKDTNYRNQNNNNNHITPVSESESSSSAAAVFAAAMSALTTTAAPSMIANSNTNPNNNDRSLVHCGNTQKMVDNCFRDLPPHLMEFLQSPKIVIDEKEIKNKCNVFHHGMRCFDDYMVRCIPKHNVRILNNNVEGARKFFTKFCDDPVFQKNYLKHKDCFAYIYDDWLHCHKQSQNIMSEVAHAVDTNVTEKFMEICCARYAYETCVFNSARYKCYKNSAKYAREMAKMLTNETQFQNCRQYEESMCNHSPPLAIGGPLKYLSTLGLLWLWLMFISPATLEAFNWSGSSKWARWWGWSIDVNK